MLTKRVGSLQSYTSQAVGVAITKQPERIIGKKPHHGKFQRHTAILIWKAYLQRQRRWRLLVVETVLGAILFLIAILIAKPVFLTPLQDAPEPPLNTKDILSSLRLKTMLGYAPNDEPYVSVMEHAAELLGTTIMHAQTEKALNRILYNKSLGTPINSPIIWVIWNSKKDNRWEFSIRSTERARYMTSSVAHSVPNPHLRAGFLAVQVAISQAIVKHASATEVDYNVNLVSMPESPLMQQNRVRKAIGFILLCFTLAFLPAILETEALVVYETRNMFKRALRVRNVSYPSMYFHWLAFAYMTAMPVCLLGAITIILVFRWIHLLHALLIVLAYMSVMTMLALIMAMFHSRARIACIWTTLFTLLMTYLAKLLVHHQYDTMHIGLTLLLHVVLPPLGLINAFNEFALLSTGRATPGGNLIYMIASWALLIGIYFGILMMLQRTIGGNRAIGGQVSWKSIIFKQAEEGTQDVLHRVVSPSRTEQGKLQEVDEFLAKAISFRDVCKDIMGVSAVKNLTFDCYRGEYTIFFTEKIQEHTIDTVDDLITGLTVADSGEIRVLGELISSTSSPLNKLYMIGYCHRSETLIDDLTVQEHFNVYSMICLWYEHTTGIIEYSLIRYRQLLKECDLESVRHARVGDLDDYYRAQLCWALAVLLEPRIIMIPMLKDKPAYQNVIKDKIMRFRKYKTIIGLNFPSLDLEYADRIFVFDSTILVFGGTPAYMFFRYGREYRVRLTLRTDSVDSPNEELLERAHAAGATVRANLGSLIILRVPAIPTAPVADLVKDLTENASKYGLTSSMSISVPDSMEVAKRAINESRALLYEDHHRLADVGRAGALRRLAEKDKWKRPKFTFNLHFKQIAWKFISFHLQHKFALLMTFLCALVAGLLLGMSLASIVLNMDLSVTTAKNILMGEVLTVESLGKKTILVVRSDNSSAAMGISEAYVMSETNASKEEVDNIYYIGLPHTESVLEYLVTRAIDSPQQYVYLHAYGMSVSSNENNTIKIDALHSPLHEDQGAAARSLARVYTSLIRYYTGQLDATIKVIDDPLVLDLSPWMKDLAQPPLFLQVLLIMTISHIIHIPSLEYGLIRHVQKYSMDFSPALYWLTLYICDLLFFWLLVGFMSLMMVAIMYIIIPESHFQYFDLWVLPMMLFLYGVGCVPQAYLFSLGPRVALNTMSFIIVNTIFGETTIIAALLYGNILSYALNIMKLSPQFNMAYAYVKIKQIFLYNTECIIFHSQNLCPANKMHKCCERCGVLQDCFKKKDYMTYNPGILTEITAMFAAAVFFIAILLLVEYKIFAIIWKGLSRKLYDKDSILPNVSLMAGIERERKDVTDKRKSVEHPNNQSVSMDTFGEYLFAMNVSQREGGVYKVRGVYLGLGRGEALGIAGLKRHGRLRLCEILAGYKLPCDGSAWTMSKWKLTSNPNMYSRNVSLSCEHQLLPSWMTVADALLMIAVLRGEPLSYAKQETQDLLTALDLTKVANKRIYELMQEELTRVHFATAVVVAPPVIIVDEVTAWQKFSVRRAMYQILYHLRKKGHAVLIAASDIESHMPATRRVAFMRDGAIYDVDTIDTLVERYGNEGYTVVVHLKDEVDVEKMFAKYFENFVVNDVSEVLVNIQIHDNLNWNQLFQKMERLQAKNRVVYSYIVTAISVDFVFNSMVGGEKGHTPATGFFTWRWAEKVLTTKPKIEPKQEDLDRLIPMEKKYNITTLNNLPWSVIFHSGDPQPSQPRTSGVHINN
ncbi:ABC transporter A family member 5-like [Anticarsia gemmatalis]|uniref:ABC transporter A family member 5-like n=1 Tax=Anticarsia gemmatalis TaxID=129554 RepID=UPI003F7710D6